ncbi:LOW QUALITY PROTEIN: F-box protein CPR1-like [Nicotiana sylvestris]
MSDVPPEVINDILYRLPVKSLLRFRCVSKSFKALIDSPKFIRAHLKQQVLKHNSDVKLIFKAHKLFSLDFSSISSSQLEELDHPLKQPYGPTQVLGSCHGLILSNNLSDNGVWNPSTKMFRKLPVCHVNPPQNHGPREVAGLSQICGGFGYDTSANDYKVVKIAQFYHFSGSSLVTVTMVYSLKLGLWKKKIQDCPYWLVKEDNGTFAAGALHWLASTEPSSEWSPWVLIGLNLGSERFELVPYPENLGKPLHLNLAVLGECLCLISGHVVVRTNAKNHVLDHVDIWVMKDYGVKESWIKLFSVEQLDGCQHFSFLRPIAYSVTGKEVLLEMDNRKFLWYSLEKKSLKHAKINGGLDFFESFVNLGTLVPLYGGGNDGGENEKDEKEKIEPEKKDGAGNIEEEDVLVIEEFKLEL